MVVNYVFALDAIVARVKKCVSMFFDLVGMSTPLSATLRLQCLRMYFVSAGSANDVSLIIGMGFHPALWARFSCTVNSLKVRHALGHSGVGIIIILLFSDPPDQTFTSVMDEQVVYQSYD